MRIWVTRTAPDDVSTATRLRVRGHAVVRAPVLDVRELDAGPVLCAPDAIAFTSLNGVRHHPADDALFGTPAFAVGRRTARAAADAGYREVRSADGDVVALQRLMEASLPPSARIVHFCGLHTAGDIKGNLERRGHRVDRRVVYEAKAMPPGWLHAVRCILPSIDGVMVHSPRAARQVAATLAGTNWTGALWCISRACADELSGLPGVDVGIASRPTEDALMALLLTLPE